MKISFYEAFDFIAEEAVELLADYSSDDDKVQNYSANTTINEVMKNIPTVRKKRKNKTTWTLRLLVAILVIFALSSTVFAIRQRLLVKDGGIELVTDANRNLIGKEIEGRSDIADSNGNIKKVSEEDNNELYSWKESTIITSVQEGAHVPRIISEFAVVDEESSFLTPEIIFTNDSMVILEKEDGKGWYMEKGEQLDFKVELYPSEINLSKGQSIIYQYIFNGELMSESLTYNGLIQNYSITAEKSGEYFLCLVGASSDPITLKQGKIVIR